MPKSLLSKVLLIAVSCIVAFAATTLILMAFPRPFLGPPNYYERLSPGQTMHYVFRETDGDLFVALPGRVRPPEKNHTLVDFTLAWDDDGFRQPAHPADAYPIAVFGDSFTEGFNVPVPYADRLAERLNIPVRNYGYRAFGPVEVAQAIRDYAPREQRRWMIYGYFSGNDLGDGIRAPKIDTHSPLAVWQALFQRFQWNNRAQPRYDPGVHYDNPMPVIIGDKYYEQVFLPYYLYWHLEPSEGFAASRNFKMLAQQLQVIDSGVSAETCRALVFIPTKEQLYYPYIYPTERQWLRGIMHRLVIDSDGIIQFASAPITEMDEPDFVAKLHSQRDAVHALVNSLPGWQFIDLLPAFEEAASRGEMLYYTYDSHWNQAGHDLAAEVIAAALSGTSGECSIARI